MMPAVSVIIPIYKVEQYIERCARSLFGQTLDDIEYIFVDDCSPDRSVDVLRLTMDDYPDRKPHIHILRNEINQGSAITRRKGIEMATGEFVICCDSDDWVEPDCYEKMYTSVMSETSDMCICDFRGIGETFVDEGFHCYQKGENFVKGLLTGNISGSLCNKLIRREFFTSDFIFPTRSFSEDFASCIQIGIKHPKISYVPEVLYNYWQHPGSMVNSVDKESMLWKLSDNIANYSLAFDALRINGMADMYINEIIIYKLKIKNSIRKNIREDGVLSVWKQTFPELNHEIHKCKYVSGRMKVAYFATLLGLYPLFENLFFHK